MLNFNFKFHRGRLPLNISGSFCIIEFDGIGTCIFSQIIPEKNKKQIFHFSAIKSQE